jgi:prepilin-type N-terminal cleavage/methylation domain-containing protein
MKRCFTLLELMIGITILAISASAIGWRVHKAAESYRFSTDVERLTGALIQCRTLALTMQSDWEGILSKTEQGWELKTECFGNVKLKGLPVQQLGLLEVFWNGEKKDSLFFLFSSTGEALVEQQRAGVLVVSRKKLQTEIKFPGIFFVG